LCYITDVYCTDPPNIVNAALQGLESRDPVAGMFTYGTVMTYSCLNGGRFEDGNTAKHIQCVLHGVWSQTQFSCDCTRARIFSHVRRFASAVYAVTLCPSVRPSVTYQCSIKSIKTAKRRITQISPYDSTGL